MVVPREELIPRALGQEAVQTKSKKTTSQLDSSRSESVVSKVIGTKGKKDHKGKKVSKKKTSQVILEDEEDEKDEPVLQIGTKHRVDR